MSNFSIVGVSGNLARPSRTSAVVNAVLDKAQEQLGGSRRLIELVDVFDALFSARSHDQLGSRDKGIIETVEKADLLVVGTPVYRGSYTGAFKHLFDLVRHDRLGGKPVILTATGGSYLHALMTEHQLRPLFGFFNALTLPTSIYAIESDFTEYKVSNQSVLSRIERVVAEAAAITGRRHPEAATAATA